MRGVKSEKSEKNDKQQSTVTSLSSSKNTILYSFYFAPEQLENAEKKRINEM